MRIEQINAMALKYADGDRYVLATAVNKRVDELYKGALTLLTDMDTKKMKHVDIALMEIAQGLITVRVS
ncbi:MAG: hypothetical protein RL154_512 [Pseudomonadota bacterium]|jgi:DNA-directed RNA polymerase subunit K/omega